MSESRVLLAFGTCEKECALPLEDIQEIVLMAWLSRPPSMASILEGFLNLRGVAIPVVSVSHICSSIIDAVSGGNILICEACSIATSC